jgi:hypothetical protein
MNPPLTEGFRRVTKEAYFAVVNPLTSEICEIDFLAGRYARITTFSGRRRIAQSITDMHCTQEKSYSLWEASK